MTNPQNFLMIPGPSQPDPEVLASLSLPVMAHYGSQWAGIYNGTIAKLRKVFQTTTKQNEVILLPCPGQLAVEMAVSNLLGKGGEAFVCFNGFFSEMISDIITHHGGKPIPIQAEYGQAVTVENVRAVVQSTPRSTGDKKRCLFLVQNETSTGVANPASDIMKVCREEGLVSILDSISAFGGMDVRVDDWKVDCCIGYPSKAIGGIFGVTPISFSKECWERAKKNEADIQSRFLNLNVWRHYIDEWGAWGHPHPSTMPTNEVIALSKALDLVLEEGLEQRYYRHKEAAKMMREGLESLGLPLFPDKRWASDTVTAARVDPKKDELIRTQLNEKYGIMIGGGLGPLRGKIIRIGHMGTTASTWAVSTVLAALREILKE
jgi:alanine-glyoxylate transaminase / serine-glyoxylate transaminase / serine-pyruvate transaminase